MHEHNAENSNCHRRFPGHWCRLVTAYRKLGYAVVANSRSIAPADDPDILTVPGDLAEPGAGTRVAEQALVRFSRIEGG
jgi:hypothetical protein